MAEEQKEAVPAEQTAAGAAAPQAPTPAQAAAPKKKTNVGVIILIIILAILILGGGISYGVYRFVKNRVKNAVSDIASTAGVSTDTSNVGTDLSDFSAVKDTTPTDSLLKSVNDTIKPIFKKLFGDAKLSLWSSLGDGGTLSYTTKDTIDTADYANLEAEIVKAGYTKNSSYNSSEAFLAYFTKGDTEITVATSSSSTNEISVICTKTATSSSQ